MEYKISELRRELTEETLKSVFTVVKGGEKLGTWYPGKDGLVKVLAELVERLEDSRSRISNSQR